MIDLDQPTVSARGLLRLLRRPHVLERDPLALRLRQSLQTASCREAVLQLADWTFAVGSDSRRLHEIVLRCDVDGQKARAAAEGMHLSLRQFFRLRAEAVAAFASSIERLDELAGAQHKREAPVYCARCYQRIIEIGGIAGAR